jgi:hypothetical protein
MMRRYFLPVLVILVTSIASCYYDNEEALYPSLNASCDTTSVTYNLTITPLLGNNCISCHSGSQPSGAVSLTSFASVQTVAASGLLMNALKGNGVSIMPPSGSMPACKISLFQIWIRNGMLNN